MQAEPFPALTSIVMMYWLHIYCQISSRRFYKITIYSCSCMCFNCQLCEIWKNFLSVWFLVTNIRYANFQNSPELLTSRYKHRMSPKPFLSSIVHTLYKCNGYISAAHWIPACFAHFAPWCFGSVNMTRNVANLLHPIRLHSLNSLLPPGCWLEESINRRHRVMVHLPLGGIVSYSWDDELQVRVIGWISDE